MKNIKLFEDFGGQNQVKEETFPKRNLVEMTMPEEPSKREFTDKERMFLFRNYKYHSWSKIDALGRIILGGGESPMGRYYITEEDLIEFMEKEKNLPNPNIPRQSW